VAFVALTVRVDEAPEAIEAGLAAMVTVGVAGGSVDRVPDLAEPHPERARKSENSNIAAKGGAIL
jgi:hypothetical protein